MTATSHNSGSKSLKPSGSNWLKGRLLVAVLIFFSYFSLASAQRFGCILGLLISKFPSRLKSTAQKNLALCFADASQQQLQQLLRQTFMHSGMQAVEMALAWLWPVEKCLNQIKMVYHKDIGDTALAEGKGVICVVPHLGNWEFLNYHFMDNRGMAMYKPAKIRALDQLILKGRKKSGLAVVPVDNSGVKAVFKHLKKGGITFILADQEPDESSGVFAPFFGIPALSMTLVAKLTQKTGAKVIAAYAKRRESHDGFDIFYKSGSDRLYSADTEEAVTALNQLVESCVLDIPEQYQWTYKRFKRRPGNAARFYQ